ncbi:hypothetical protein CMV_016738 [Castanea mollissima]|uniref:Uncharacterized protein n=1 Tax=Castanea mollissima TaxID=60419 RepID=A0A8J4VRD6_9ROSI|nr:hypothetical protein CMV_016738 [Castanea mollissima]
MGLLHLQCSFAFAFDFFFSFLLYRTRSCHRLSQAELAADFEGKKGKKCPCGFCLVLSRLPQVVNPKLNGNLVNGPYEALPGFRDVPGSEKQNLFIKKLNLGCDFGDREIGSWIGVWEFFWDDFGSVSDWDSWGAFAFCGD